MFPDPAVLLISGALLTPYAAMVVRWWRTMERGAAVGAAVASGAASGGRDISHVPHVLVACRNEAQRVLPLLDALHRGAVPADVTLVDDGSEDGTAEGVAAWTAAHPGRVTVRVVPSAGVGKKAALRTGFSVLPETVDHVVLTDADARPGPEWLAGWASAVAQAPEVAMWIGEVRIGLGAGARGAVERQEFAAMMAWAEASARRGRPANASGANLCVRRAAWSTADLQDDVASGDDVFLAQHLTASGADVRWWGEERSVVVVDPTPSWGALLQQRARWGRKSNRYIDRSAMATAVLVVATNVGMIVGVAAGAWPVVGAKVLLDAVLTRRAMGARWRAWEALVFAALYPLVVVASVGLAQFFPSLIHWKGRPNA